ncbi:MAG: hypothetical protein NXI21_17980, partial [Alphaproteobacteria bacterium]|nr:hypothetical protein [Alphaproteobacteria bacterium]
MRPLLLFAAALALAACAAGRPASPTADPTRDALARFQAAPDRLGLFVLDVAGGSLRDWAVVLQSLDAPGLEITFRPDRGKGAVRGVETVARAAPAGRWRAVRALAVQDGRPCTTGAAPDAA